MINSRIDPYMFNHVSKYYFTQRGTKLSIPLLYSAQEDARHQTDKSRSTLMRTDLKDLATNSWTENTLC